MLKPNTGAIRRPVGITFLDLGHLVKNQVGCMTCNPLAGETQYVPYKLFVLATLQKEKHGNKMAELHAVDPSIKAHRGSKGVADQPAAMLKWNNLQSKASTLVNAKQLPFNPYMTPRAYNVQLYRQGPNWQKWVLHWLESDDAEVAEAAARWVKRPEPKALKDETAEAPKPVDPPAEEPSTENPESVSDRGVKRLSINKLRAAIDEDPSKAAEYLELENGEDKPRRRALQILEEAINRAPGGSSSDNPDSGG